jgi:hypothetical protein
VLEKHCLDKKKTRVINGVIKLMYGVCLWTLSRKFSFYQCYILNAWYSITRRLDTPAFLSPLFFYLEITIEIWFAMTYNTHLVPRKSLSWTQDRLNPVYTILTCSHFNGFSELAYSSEPWTYSRQCSTFCILKIEELVPFTNISYAITKWF